MKTKYSKKKMGTMDKILLTMAILLIVFTIAMIVIFCKFQTVPDTLITSFFASFGAEGGFMAVIMVAKTIKRGNDEADEEIILH